MRKPAPLASALSLVFALAALLVAPTALAANAQVALEKVGEAWNGESRVDLAPTDAPREVDVWVPSNARIHGVLYRLAEGGGPANWQASGPDAIRVSAPGDATAVSVLFDVPERRPYLVRFVAPEGVGFVSIVVVPPDGSSVESPQVHFAENRAPAFVKPGDTIAIRIVERGRVGELPLLVTIGAIALAALLLTTAWHSLRPPLGGRAPEKFLEHLSELQARIVPVAILFAILNLFFFTSGLRTIQAFPYVLPTWGVDSSIAARAFDAVAERLVPPDVTLVVLRPADAVLAQVGMCLLLSIAAILPLLIYELTAFIAPGLEAKEKRLASRVIPIVTGLFLAGALLGYLVMAPLMIRTLYAYAPGIGAQPLLAVGELVSFSLLVILSLGAAFEMPVVMYVLARIGLVKARTFGKYVRHAMLAIIVLAGVITPDPSVVSQLLLAVPIVALYVLGIGAAAVGERAGAATA